MTIPLFSVRLLPFTTLTPDAVEYIKTQMTYYWQQIYQERTYQNMCDKIPSYGKFSTYTKFLDDGKRSFTEKWNSFSENDYGILQLALCEGLGFEKKSYYGVDDLNSVLKHATVEKSNEHFSKCIKNYKYLEESSVLAKDTSGNMRLLLALLIGFGIKDKINVYEKNFYDHILTLFSSRTISTEKRNVYILSAGTSTESYVPYEYSLVEKIMFCGVVAIVSPVYIVAALFGQIDPRRM
jgi:hypothetical protein